MIEGFSKDTIIVCTKLSTELKDLSDEAWLSGAVYPPYSDNVKIYTDGITIGKEYKVTERTIIGENPAYDTVSIINDYGSERYYLSELFISKSEWRNNKLKEIGI
jgi:hypothetical protein